MNNNDLTQKNIIFLSAITALVLQVIATIARFCYMGKTFSRDSSTVEFGHVDFFGVLNSILFLLPFIFLAVYVYFLCYKNKNIAALVPSIFFVFAARIFVVLISNIGHMIQISYIIINLPIAVLYIISAVCILKGGTGKKILVVSLVLHIVMNTLELSYVLLIPIDIRSLFPISYYLEQILLGFSNVLLAVVLLLLYKKEKASFMNVKIEEITLEKMSAKEALQTIEMLYNSNKLTKEEYNAKRKEIIDKL